MYILSVSSISALWEGMVGAGMWELFLTDSSIDLFVLIKYLFLRNTALALVGDLPSNCQHCILSSIMHNGKI